MAAMRKSRVLAWLCVTILGLTGCQFQPLPESMIPDRYKAASGNKLASTTDPNAPAVIGRVFGLDGKPAANVQIHGYLVSNNAGSLISNNAGGLVSNNAGSLVSNNAGSYRIQAEEGPTTYTDGDGNFKLAADSGTILNVEAVLQDNVRAIAQGVSNTSNVSMQLAYTGSISGQVDCPEQPTVQDFTGVDVFVPGTSYMAKADAAGRFTLTNVAVGTFQLVALKTGLGQAAKDGVKVESKQTASAGTLSLSLNKPIITAVAPAWGAVGSEIILKGFNFGATTGETLSVSFKSGIATQVSRLDNQTLKVMVPSGATTGEVVVTVGGINSNAGAFTVINRVSISESNFVLALDENPQAYEIQAIDTSGKVVPDAQPELQASGPISTWYDSVSGDYLLRGTGVGFGTLRIKLGDLTDEIAVMVEATLPRVTTLAGEYQSKGMVDASGDSARFSAPFDLVMGPDGNLRVVDKGNHALRMVTADGAVSTVIGNGRAGDGWDQLRTPSRIAVDQAAGVYYVSEPSSNRIRRIDSSGGVTTLFEGQLSMPTGLAVDKNGVLYVCESQNNRIVKIVNDSISVVAGTGVWGYLDGPGSQARFAAPDDIAVDDAGNLYVAEAANSVIRKITPDGTVSTLAGRRGDPGDWDGKGTGATFYSPSGICVDKNGNVLVTDTWNNDLRLITPDGNVFCIAGVGDGDGDDDGPALVAARFWGLCGVTVAEDGTIYMCEGANDAHRIRVMKF